MSNGKMRSYEAARRLFSIMETGCRVLIGLAVLGCLISLVSLVEGGASNLGVGGVALIFSPALIAIVVCSLFLANIQSGRASVDTAEYTQQVLDVARKQLEVSRQALEQNKRVEATYAALVAIKPAAKPAESIAEEGASYAHRDPSKELPKDALQDEGVLISNKPPSDATPSESLAPSVLAIEDKPAVRLRAVDLIVEQRKGKFLVQDKVFNTKLEANMYRERMLTDAGLV